MVKFILQGIMHTVNRDLKRINYFKEVKLSVYPRFARQTLQQ